MNLAEITHPEYTGESLVVRPYRRAGPVGVPVGRVVNRYRVAKHFDIEIEKGRLSTPVRNRLSPLKRPSPWTSSALR